MDPAPASGPEHPAGDLLARVEREVRAVLDPEIPVLTIEDLGVIRAVDQVGAGLVVTLTPTYSGCPAMHAMEQAVLAAMAAASCSIRRAIVGRAYCCSR